jgi:hypothetical protein
MVVRCLLLFLFECCGCVFLAGGYPGVGDEPCTDAY